MAKAKENTDSSKNTENTYEYNFIDIPWDNRSTTSKLYVVLLFISIIVVLFAAIIINLCIHYKGFTGIWSHKKDFQQCQSMPNQDFPYVAHLEAAHSGVSMCVGAVLGRATVLVNSDCIDVKIFFMITFPHKRELRCRQGFASRQIIDFTDYGTKSKQTVKLSALIAANYFGDCAGAVNISRINDHSSDFTQQKNTFTSLGLNSDFKKVVTRQVVDQVRCGGIKIRSQSNDSDKLICVAIRGGCPISTGDLLLYENELVGICSVGSRVSGDIRYATFYIVNSTKIKEYLEDIIIL